MIFRSTTIYWDESMKIPHEYVFSYRSMRNHSQSLTLKFINSTSEEHMKTKSVKTKEKMWELTKIRNTVKFFKLTKKKNKTRFYDVRKS